MEIRDLGDAGLEALVPQREREQSAEGGVDATRLRSEPVLVGMALEDEGVTHRRDRGLHADIDLHRASLLLAEPRSRPRERSRPHRDRVRGAR